MNQTPDDDPDRWTEIGVLAMLGGLIGLMALMQRGSLEHAVITLVFFGIVVGIGLLWQSAVREAEAQPPLARWQRAWHAGVFLLCLAAMAGLGWYYYGGASEGVQTRPEERPGQRQLEEADDWPDEVPDDR